jgi:hypothetical protein
MSRIDSRHSKISTNRHFQNGHHNTARIQHRPISSKFELGNAEFVRHCGGHFENGDR